MAEDTDQLFASPLLGESASAMLAQAIMETRNHNDAGRIQRGLVSYATEALWPSIGDMALSLRGGGARDLGDGWSLVGDPDSPRHRTDLLLTGPDRAFHVFVSHAQSMSDDGKVADQALRKSCVHDIIDDILRPGPERRAFLADPTNWLDPKPGDFVRRIGVTRLESVPVNGFADFRPVRTDEADWWPDMVLNLRPNMTLHHGFDTGPHISTVRVTDDPFGAVFLLEMLSRSVVAAGAGHRVAARSAWLSGLQWEHYGQSCDTLPVSAGLRLVHEAGGLVTHEVRKTMEMVERRCHARCLDMSLDLLRDLPDMLRAVGASDREDALSCNDGRDIAWTTYGEGAEILHLETDSGRFELELVEDGSVRMLKAADERILLESLRPGPEGLEPMFEGDDGMTIDRLRMCNGIRFSLESVACHVDNETTPSPE